MNFIGTVKFLELYFVAIIFSLLFEAFGIMEKQKKKKYLIFFLSFLAFLTAFRMDCIGNDTSSYIKHYTTISSYSNLFDCIKKYDMEPGYVTYCWLLSRFSYNPQTLLIATSIIVYISTGLFAYKYVNNPGLFCCLFIGIMQFDFFMSALRQSIAIAILLFSFTYIIEKNQ